MASRSSTVVRTLLGRCDIVVVDATTVAVTAVAVTVGVGCVGVGVGVCVGVVIAAVRFSISRFGGSTLNCSMV
jgi:hypothetical protein